MKRYSEILRDLEEMLGRKLNNDEIDHCYITQITGGWGFAPLLAETGYRTWRQAKRLEGINGSYSECVDRISHKPKAKEIEDILLKLEIPSPGSSSQKQKQTDALEYCWSLREKIQAEGSAVLSLLDERFSESGWTQSQHNEWSSEPSEDNPCLMQ